jgi:acyl transferase domain-containing protein
MVSLAIVDRVHRWASASYSLTVATPVTPVAVVGEACRVPGRIDAPEQLRGTLLRSHGMITQTPPDRRDADESLIAGSRPELTEALHEVADGDAPYHAVQAYTEPTG